MIRKYIHIIIGFILMILVFLNNIYVNIGGHVFNENLVKGVIIIFILFDIIREILNIKLLKNEEKLDKINKEIETLERELEELDKEIEGD